MKPNPADLHTLLLNEPKSAADLLKSSQISQPTLSRWIRSNPKIKSFGAKKSALYAIERNILGHAPPFPLFRITESGAVQSIGRITPVMNRGYIWEPETGAPRVFGGIPYFLSDQRPSGFLGRLFHKMNPSPGLPTRIEDFSEDQIFYSLLRYGENLTGQWLVGKESFDRYQNLTLHGTSTTLAERPKKYENMALSVLNQTPLGSSMAGEQPKFTAQVTHQNTTRHVLVKFSPPLDTPQGRRWGDLLIAEFHALNTLKEENVDVAETELIMTHQRVFLESTRFDRIGEQGRKGMVSFAAIEAETIGRPSNWSESTKILRSQNMISSQDEKTIVLLDAYGALIANSDRHYGNLSFYLEAITNKISLAPAYDMLPMYFAPQAGAETIQEVAWIPPKPTATTLSEWERARFCAIRFWENLSADQRISLSFKNIAKTCLSLLKT